MKYNININKRVFNDKFLPLLNCDKRYMILYGGSGSGKSVFVCQRYVYLLMTLKGMNLLVIRNTGRSNRDSTFALFQQIISQWNCNQLFIINKGDMRIKCLNGNEVIFSGLDDVEKLKSVTFSNGILTDIWIEEASEVNESDFNQLDIRLRGKGSRKQIVLSFNPIDINHWIKRKFIDEPADNVVVNHSTYLDNRFIDDDYKRLLESYKDTDKYHYEVYCLGHFGVFGDSIFDKNKISDRLQHLPPILKQGSFKYDYDGDHIDNIVWTNDEHGFIRIYRDVEQGHRYCIGGDTSGGESGKFSDYFVGQVIDADTGEQLAILRHQFDSDQFARQMYCLGKYYNNALLTIEMNFDSYPIRELERLGYKEMFIREMQDAFTGTPKKAYGFRTDSISRPRIISQLVEIVRDHIELFNDKVTLEEMISFVRNEKGRPEAMNGCHDDCVMAIAIAHEGVKQVPIKFKFEPMRNDDQDFFDYGT